MNILLFLLTSICPALTSTLYPFGQSNGDFEVTKIDDGTSQVVQLQESFPFGLLRENRLWLSDNGFVSFGNAVSNADPVCRNLDQPSRLIAAFWADVDLNEGGQLFYRQTRNPAQLNRATRDVVKRFPQFDGIEMKWMFVATWYEVASFIPQMNKPGNDTGKNTFQLALVTDGILGFIVTNYDKIEWTNGYRGHAKVGYDAGNSVHFETLPQSCSEQIGSVLLNNTNFNEMGRYVYRVDGVDITQTAARCGGNKIVPFPCMTDSIGYAPISFSGPCFPANASRITCEFDDPVKGKILKRAVLTNPAHLPPMVKCIAPYFYENAMVTVHVNFELAGGQKMTYVTQISVIDYEQPSVGVNEVGEDVVLSWDTDAKFLMESSQVDIKLVALNRVTETIENVATIATKVSNSGSFKMNVSAFMESVADRADLVEKLSSSLVSISIEASKLPEKLSRITTADHFIDLVTRAKWLGFTKFIFFGLKDGFNLEGLREGVLRDFAATDAPANLASCPCWRSSADIDSRFQEEGYPGKLLLPYFHPGAVASYRGPRTSTGAGQQCVYGFNGYIITGQPNGGSADYVSPVGFLNIAKHFWYDVLPFIFLCKRSSNCAYYFEKRPSDSCADYNAPSTAAQAIGDPHFTTFDGFGYTFNGAGEFWLVRGIESDFGVQTRLEPRGSGTIFTAFAFKQYATRLQVQKSRIGAQLEVSLNGKPLCLKLSGTQEVNGGDIVVTDTRGDLSEVLIMMTCGLSLRIRNGPTLILVSALAYPPIRRGTLRGLLGNNDGVFANDLILPNGTFVFANSNLATIHWDFGMKWMVSQNESAFFYESGTSYATFSMPNFGPLLQDIDWSNLPTGAVELCGTSRQCVFDFVATGDVALANSTFLAQLDFNVTNIQLNEEARQDTEAKCSDISGSFQNGKVAYSSGVVNGSLATFQCESGFQLIGQSVLQCLPNPRVVSWNSTLPICQRQQPSTTTQTSTTIASTKKAPNANNVYFPVGDSCSCTCTCGCS